MAALIATLSQGIADSPQEALITFSQITSTNTTESSEPDRLEEEGDVATQVLIDTFAVFGAMFVAAIAILLVSVYVSRLRKRQNQQMMPSIKESGSNLSNQNVEAADQTDPFEVKKPTVVGKILRAIMFRLKGQEQHKDVCELPPHLRAQLKHIYVY